MSTLFPRPIAVERKTDGSYQGGIWVDGDEETIAFIGSVQPMSGKEMDALDVGRRDLGKVKVYSSTPLLVSTEGGDTPGDIVQWQGQRWELIQELRLQNDIIPHYKYVGEFRGEVGS